MYIKAKRTSFSIGQVIYDYSNISMKYGTSKPPALQTKQPAHKKNHFFLVRGDYPGFPDPNVDLECGSGYGLHTA
jgi:hypothetical protein